MSKFTSIRIYVTGGLIQGGFYDVIGYHGPALEPSNGWYNIDTSQRSPLIKASGEYYYLTYSTEEGYSVNTVSTSDLNGGLIHPLTELNLMMVYQDQKGDFNGIGYDYPLNLNIAITGISSLRKVAYRLYYMEIKDGYAIRTFDSTIHDEDHILDSTSEELILAETNPDDYVFDPEGGEVTELYQFTVDCGKLIYKVNQSVGNNDICVYDGNTKSIVQHVDRSTISYSLGERTFSFTLTRKITTSGLYFLYLPSELIEFNTSVNSPLVLIGYRIPASDSNNDIYSYSYTSMGRSLGRLLIKFENVTDTIDIDQTKYMLVVGPEDNDSISTSNITLVSGSHNTVQLDFGKTYYTPGEYTITIPIGTLALSPTISNPLMILTYTIVDEDELLPTAGDVLVKFSPTKNSKLFKIDKVVVKFCIDDYLNKTKSVGFGNGGFVSITSDSTNTVIEKILNCSTSIEYESGYKMYVFTFLLHNPITTPGSYTVLVKGESFVIGTNAFSEEYSFHYTVIELNESNKNSKYCYDMLEVVPTEAASEESPDATSFRKDNTIFVNGLYLDLIKFSPVISLLTSESNELTKVTYYNPYAEENRNNLLQMEATLDALLSSGEWKSETVTYNFNDLANSSAGFLYGLDNSGTRQSYKLFNLNLSASDETDGLFFKNYKVREVPRSMNLMIYIKLNGYSVQTNINILILENDVYVEYKDNPTWTLEKTIDIYSGEECKRAYATVTPTNKYDSILKEVEINQQGNPENRYIIALEPITKVRLGNLDGIFDETFGKKQPFGYGLYGLNVFLTGNFYLNNGRSLLDVDNDITMAVGEVNTIKKNLEQLDERIATNADVLDLKISDAEKGISSTISNYISTNRDAVFKLGLDYSMWSLGSAGISLYNPNVKYVTDENGERIVDPTTVGDFDEGILIQADRLRINNYESIEINNETYYRVLVTSANPKDWIYPDLDSSGLFLPKMPGNRKVPFKYFYIKQSSFLNGTNIRLESTLGCDEILRYVYIQEDTEGNPYVPSVVPSEDFISYAFNSYYCANFNRQSNSRLVFYNLTSNGSNVQDSMLSDLVWFLPSVVQAAMFHNGKIYAKYIDTEGLQVEYLLAISKDLLKYDPYGVKNIRPNPIFDITRPIDDSNYPVIYDLGTYTFDDEGEPIVNSVPEKNVPFVAISGYTGKITARSADIYGTVTIGDRSVLNGKYLVLSDNIDEDSAVELGKTPAMYIMSNDNGYPRVIAKFSGDDEGNLLKRYFDVDSSFSFSGSTSINTASSHTLQPGMYVLPGNMLDSFNTISNNNSSTRSPYGYKVNSSSDHTTGVICTIGSSNDIRNLRFNIGVGGNGKLGLYQSTLLSSIIQSGKAVGYIYFNVDIYIRETGSSTGTSIGRIYKYIGFGSGGISSMMSRGSLLTNAILNPNTNGYELYYDFYTVPNYYIYSNYYSSVSSSYPMTVKSICDSLSVDISSNSLEYFSQYTGNGTSSGFDLNNYFGSYYEKDSQGYPKMVTQLRSGGIGFSFDKTNAYHLLPNKFMIPMYIPIVYFRCSPTFAGTTDLIVPSIDASSCSRTVHWLVYENSDYNRYQQLNTDLINFHALKGDFNYTYPSTYGDTLSTPRERSGYIIKLNADAIYEFNFSKLNSLLYSNYGIGIYLKNVRVNFTRTWGSYYDGSHYWTDLGYDSYTPKVNTITGNTVYISTLYPDDGDHRYDFEGCIEVYFNPNNSSGEIISTDYTSDEMTSIINRWNNILSQLDARYQALTNELKQQQNLNNLMLEFSSAVNSLTGLTNKTQVDSITSGLASKKILIEGILTDLESQEPSGSEEETGSITITISSSYASGIPSEGISGTQLIATYTTTYEGTHSVAYKSGSEFLSSLAIPTEGLIIASASSTTTARSETLTLTIGEHSLDFTISQNAPSGGDDPVTPDPVVTLSWSSNSFTYDGTNMSSKPTLSVSPSGTSVTYSSSSTSVASINSSGTITVPSGVTSGSTTITATAGSVTASYTFTVNIAVSQTNWEDTITVTDSDRSTLDYYLPYFAQDITALNLANEHLDDHDSDIYKFIAATQVKGLELCPSSIASGPVNGVSSPNFAAKYSWMLALILTMMYPATGTSSVTYSNHGNMTYQFFQSAMRRYGVMYNNSTYDADQNIPTYTSRYAGQLIATIGFARLIGDSSFRTRLKELKNTTYASNFLLSYMYNDGTDFLDSSITMNGTLVVPMHLGTNVDASVRTLLLDRDVNSYTSGKSLRSYASNPGAQAYDDRNDALNYYIDIMSSANSKTASQTVGSYTTDLGVGSLAGSGSRYYSSSSNANKRQSYISGSDAYTETGWLTYVNSNKPNVLTNPKFAHLYFSLGHGNKVGNKVKNAGTATGVIKSDANNNWWRYRPCKVYSEGTDDLSTTTIEGLDSDTANLIDSTSYPSGHSGYGWGMALVWISMFNLSSSETTNVAERAYQYTQGRVIVGAHWLTCVEIARLTASCGFAQMCGNKLFIESLDRAQQ